MKGPDSYIFKTVVRFLFFLVNVLALYLLLRGHNLPGGGFIAGLATAISLILLSFALGLAELHRIIRIDPVRLAAGGLLLAALSGAAPLVVAHPYLEQFNFHFRLPLLGEVHAGTPLIFDTGVFLVVVGVIAKIIFVLAKSTQGMRALVQQEEHRYSSVVESPIEDEILEEESIESDAGAHSRKEPYAD
jgi:multicomponent Na+:H+ antiporter subunit B